MKNLPYVLGHSAFELERLARQERLIGKMTREYFANAGIGPGMRVLDVGSGTGVVAFHAAELVGRSGEVIGTDLAPEAVATGNKNAAELGLSHVSFRQGNPVEMSFDQPFDAIVGRYVLLFQADQSEMLRRLAKLLKPRGIIVFHEPDWSFVRSDPVAPVYDRCCAWITSRSSTSRTINFSSALNFAITQFEPSHLKPVLRSATHRYFSNANAGDAKAQAASVAQLMPMRAAVISSAHAALYVHCP